MKIYLILYVVVMSFGAGFIEARGQNLTSVDPERIIVDLPKAGTPDRVSFSYPDHPDPADYRLKPQLDIEFHGYKTGENIEVTLSLPNNKKIPLTKDKFVTFKIGGENPTNLHVLEIDSNGAVKNLQDNTARLEAPFTIKVVYRKDSVVSKPIGKKAEQITPGNLSPKKSNDEKKSFCEDKRLVGPNAIKLPFCDAMKLAAGLREGTLYSNILSKYKGFELRDHGPITKSFKDSVNNPIFNKLLKAEQRIDRFTPPTAASIKDLSKISEVAAGIISPEIAGGLAIFIAERFKQELQVSFFGKFQETLRDDQHADLQHLFPMTYGFLTNREVEPWNYNQYLALLRAAFKRDFDMLPSGLKKLLLARKEAGKIDDARQDACLATLFALELVESVRAAKYPADVIEDLKRFSAIKGASPDFQNSVELLAGLSRNLRQSSDGKWIPARDLNAMLSEPTAIAVFAGLMLEDSLIAKIEFEEKKLTDWLRGLNKLDDVVSYYYEFFDKIRNAEISLQTLNDLRNRETPPTFDDYFSYLGTAITLTETAFDVKRITANAVSLPINETYIQISRDVLSLWEGLNKKEYAIVLASLLDIVQKTFPESSPLRADLLKYGTFMANMIAAESPEQVAQVIEAAALPVGSHRIKKISNFSVALNAFAGGAFAREYLRADSLAVNKKSWVVAFTSPVGLALSWGKESKCSRWLPGKSFSLFVSVLDLGALTSYRLQKGGDFPEFEVKNIVAPGGYVAFGFDGPFALGLGAQYGPELRKVDAKTMKSQITTSAWRAGAFLTVDIPIFNFYKN